MNYWATPILLEILFTYSLYPYLFKRFGTGYSLLRRTRLMFALVFFLNLSVSTWFGLGISWGKFAVIMAIGLLNYFATLAYQRAMEFSLSQTALFTQGDDLIGMSLALLLLGETNVLNRGIVVGATLCLASAILLSVANWRSAKAPKTATTKLGARFYGLVAVYTLVWGATMYLIRFWALQNISFISFATPWYAGTVLSSVIVCLISGEKGRGKRLTGREVGWTSVLALLTWMAMFLHYWVKETTPVMVNQPIMQAGEMIIPALLGLYLFKEREQLSLTGQFLFGLALAGAVVIGFSYSHN